jgi:osmotically-inducible protein OsmY
MRKYGKWLLVLGVLAASPAVASADGFLGGKFKPVLPFSGSAEKGRNQELANEVAAALKTAQVRGTGIEIEVRDGAAILSGSVSDPSQRSLAQRAAGSVPGIERVENNLKYIPQTAGQPAIAQAAHEQSTAKQPSMIQQVAAEAPAPAPAQKSNQETAQQIAQAVQSCGVDCEMMTVRFKDGVCTLEGSVGTAAERQALHRAAAAVPGVRQMNNRLTVAQPVARVSAPANPPQMAMPQQMMAPPTPVAMGPAPMMMGAPGAPPTASGYAPTSFNNPNLPNYAWPAYAAYPNSAAVSYPTQYSASAWPYIGPFYPYPQVPMGWREVSLEWDDGYWQLNFNKEKNNWFWVMNPKNW